ncbi:MAG: DUF362 domain-containing protein [Candidatus Pacearchaeota archaeon]|nr:MAG: DUF362 domain-containing protein [Candidatus Pacearchaeota archaeon]
MTIVYHSKNYNKFLKKIKEELERTFKGCKRIAIKIHFGEPGNKTAFTPQDIKPVTNLLKDLDIGFFLFDSPVVYHSLRNNPKTYKKYAAEKGWSALGEIVISNDFVIVKGKNLKYEVCKPLVEADGVLVISHIKGHACSGFGGAIKNLGMGAVTKKTKKAIHDGGMPVYKGGCVQCGECEKACPLDTLKVKDKPIFGECYGCSNCIYVCPQNAIKPKVNYFDTLLAESASIAETKFKKIYYISFLKNITKECDCGSNPGKIIAKDSGYLASKYAVAIDMAAYNIITKNSSEDVFLKFNKKSGVEQVKEAEKFGMGSSKYKLKEI